MNCPQDIGGMGNYTMGVAFRAVLGCSVSPRCRPLFDHLQAVVPVCTSARGQFSLLDVCCQELSARSRCLCPEADLEEGSVQSGGSCLP